MSNIDISVHENETERQYIWRLHKYVENGEITWKEMARFVNINFRESEEDYRDESAYRKPCQSAEAYYDEVFSKMIGTEYSNDIAEQRRLLERSKIQFRDERNAWQKQNYTTARVEQKLDYLEGVLKQQGKINFDVPDTVNINSDNDMLVMLSDLHIGQCFSTQFGEYNSDIARERLEKYLAEIIKIQKRHNSENCFVSIQGDLISGNIHKTIAVTNRENVIEQIKLASEIISSFCYELTKVFKHVYMQDCSGNHSRLDRKDDALHSERLDDLISWNVGMFLSHIPNFKVLNDKLDIGIAKFDIRGKTYLATHGDFDNFSKQGVANLSFMIGFIPYAILCGHRHFPAMSDFSGVKMMQSGSLVGSGDDYTIEKRLTGKASQTVCICNDKGIECYYPIELN